MCQSRQHVLRLRLPCSYQNSTKEQKRNTKQNKTVHNEAKQNRTRPSRTKTIQNNAEQKNTKENSTAQNITVQFQLGRTDFLSCLAHGLSFKSPFVVIIWVQVSNMCAHLLMDHPETCCQLTSRCREKQPCKLRRMSIEHTYTSTDYTSVWNDPDSSAHALKQLHICSCMRAFQIHFIHNVAKVKGRVYVDLLHLPSMTK